MHKLKALPIFLDALLPAWGAILISVTLVLAFGEIIPQAVCSRYGLSVGAKLSVVVRILVIVFFPLSYPISKLLDLVLGKKHSALLRRAELKSLVDMHGNEAGKGGELTHDETTIITGALDLAQKTAKDAMTPVSMIFSVDLNSNLNEDTMSLMMSKGHSRIPVHSGSPTNIVGLIWLKVCSNYGLKMKLHSETLTSEEFLEGSQPHGCGGKDDSNSSLQNQGEETGSENKLQNTCSNATSVASSNTEIRSPASQLGKCGDEIIVKALLESLPYQVEEAIGIITMEDVLEELLQEEILDETDEYVDVHDKLQINMLPPMWSSSRSPGAPSHMMRQSPVPSPFSSSHPTPSSKHHTTVLRSPISPYIRSPFVRPTLYASPGKSVTSSPTEYTSFTRSSPSSHMVPRKEYEKLRKGNAS